MQNFNTSHGHIEETMQKLRQVSESYLSAQQEQRGQGNVQVSISLYKPQLDAQQEHL